GRGQGARHRHELRPGARGGVRHAVRGVEGEVPEGSNARATAEVRGNQAPARRDQRALVARKLFSTQSVIRTAMPTRRIRQLVPAIEVTEGAGVTVHRTLGTPRLRYLDPFLMLDHFGSDDPDRYIAGFPNHPHRGFITLTYMIDGHMLHRDSMGNRGDLRAGGIQ